MAVKPARPDANATEVEHDLHELLALLGRVLPALKRGGDPPNVLVEAAQRASLGPRHAPVLIMAALERDLSISELAERIGLSISTTSLMVGELSRAGIVERIEDERDRRRTLVRLHPDHAAEVVTWMQARIAPVRRTLERLPATTRAHFLEGWRMLDEEVGGALEAERET
jgi:DNA-binding MarR family transcriptional regulator